MGILQEPSDRKISRESVSPETLARLQDETQFQIGKTDSKHFQFVLILVDESELKEVPSIISTVVGTLLRHGATLSNIASSLLVGLLGVPFPDRDSPQVRRDLVDALLKENGKRIRIAHGQCEGIVGLLGTKERCTLGEIIPGFSGILKKLLETEFGLAVEVNL